MILKLQQGGASLPPLATFTPLNRPTKADTTTAASESSKGHDLTDKDLLTMLDTLNGLPSDMQILTSSLQNFYINQQYDKQLDTSNIASRYLSTLQQLKIANFNKKEYDDAFNIVSSNGGINEFAISSRGQLVCVNKEGDFKLLTIEDLKNSEGYSPLTNSELLQYRAYSPSMAFKNDVLSVIKNGIGIETVNKMISDIASKIGTNEESQNGYEITKRGRIIKGLQDFYKAVQEASNNINYDGSIEDLYKYKFLTKGQAKNAEYAMQYIYTTLPENAKTLLKLKTKQNTDQEAQSLIGTLIASQLDSTKQFDIDLVAGKTADKTKTGSGSSADDTKLKTSLPLNVMKGIGGYDQEMVVDKGNGIGMSVVGTYYQQVKSTSGDSPIINTSLENMLAKSGLQSIVKNMNNITFGDQKLSPKQLHNITYNNTGIIRAELPINPDGTVRLDILEDYEKAQNDIKLLGESPEFEKISKIYKDYGLDDLLLANGLPNTKKFGTFIVTEGYTSETNGIVDSEYVKRKDLTDQEMQLYKDSLTIGTGKDKQVPEVDEDSWWPGDWWGMYDHMYKAAIYIPINNNVNSAVYGAGQNLDYDEAVEQETKYQNFNKVSNLQTTNADVLQI